MPLDEELTAWLRLTLIPGLYGDRLRRLLSAFGRPQAVFSASATALSRHVPDAVAAAIKRGIDDEAINAVAGWLQDPANQVVTLADPNYPQQLLQVPDPPPLLYVKGSLDLLRRPALAIVGSRNATAQGEANAEAFARILSDSGLTIVSGLALGVDAAAHRGALAGSGSSIAVLGTGADIIYPARNRALAHDLAERGVLVSEFALGTRPIAANFPRRNRLISGLALGCLVVEAAAESGSLITARLANEQGREVFAIPGSIHSPLAKGCHALIKQGAKLVESAHDVLEELRWPAHARSEPAPRNSPIDAHTRRLLDALGEDPCERDTLAARSGLSAAEISVLLTQLELDGTVATLPGGSIQRIHR
ncbi:MAG: DNA-processing protein DprA [Betaproteobacteria bacterium]|nr:DNA-processing protein DprA [Betaproteobacteria bacterium]MDH3437492.1 DNA-processing protein DprA [Betaproteobacteria bacterium]